MDRPTTRIEADSRGPRVAHGEAFVLPSRRPALDACRGSLGAGPILLTGEAGAGKTWLWRTVAASSPPSLRWMTVDLTPADGPGELYRQIGHELGLVEPGSWSRVGLVDALAERHDDGERPVLVVEEAHNLTPAVGEAVRLLANKLGEPGGFAGLILVGQTALSRRFSTRPFAGIESRLAARAHLGPIDADEARELLDRLRPGRTWSVGEVEALHRDSTGNPGRLLRKAGPNRLPTPAAAAFNPPRPEPPPRTAPAETPVRPPLVVEENVIEVGWSPEDEAAPGDFETPSLPGIPVAQGVADEEVRDHYAALQAWREWSENQVKQGMPSSRSRTSDVGPSNPIPDDVEATSPLSHRSTIRAEGEQPFAPLGQLFTRLGKDRVAD